MISPAPPITAMNYQSQPEISVAPKWTQLKIVSKGTSPVDLSEAKRYLNYTGAGQDELITELIAGAVNRVETITRRPLSNWVVEGAWDIELGATKMLLPYPPIISITSIKYIDNTGAEATLDATKYEATTGQNGFVKVNEYPSATTEDNLLKYKVEYQCGYASKTDIPPDLLIAVKMLVNSWFLQRIGGDSKGDLMSAIYGIVSPHVVPVTR